MKINKTISDKVVNANRANAKKSTGAKTATGKKNSRGNALRNGLFASELYVAEGEQQEFQTLRREIGSELVPETALQRLAVDEIVACSWKMKLADQRISRPDTSVRRVAISIVPSIGFVHLKHQRM